MSRATSYRCLRFAVPIPAIPRRRTTAGVGVIIMSRAVQATLTPPRPHGTPPPLAASSTLHIASFRASSFLDKLGHVDDYFPHVQSLNIAEIARVFERNLGAAAAPAVPVVAGPSSRGQSFVLEARDALAAAAAVLRHGGVELAHAGNAVSEEDRLSAVIDAIRRIVVAAGRFLADANAAGGWEDAVVLGGETAEDQRRCLLTLADFLSVAEMEVRDLRGSRAAPSPPSASDALTVATTAQPLQEKCTDDVLHAIHQLRSHAVFAHMNAHIN